MAALTLRVSPKWVDNVLSHHDVPGVERRARGRERRLDAQAMLALALIRSLSADLHMTLAAAAAVSARALARPDAESAEVAPHVGITLRFALADARHDLMVRLRDAAEEVAHVRRGRPPRRPVAGSVE